MENRNVEREILTARLDPKYLYVLECACFFGAVRIRRGREFYAIKWTSFGVHLVVGTVFRAAGNRVGAYIGCARLRRP